MVGSGIFVYLCKSDISGVQGHPRSLDFGANRKRVCDFLLVRNGNLGPNLYRSEILQLLCAPDPTPISP